MDGCSTISEEHNSSQRLLGDSTTHFAYIYCRNHGLALCFTHLIPEVRAFEKFDSLLLNLYLLMKNSNVRQSIFEEVQAAYNLPSLKLIKASVTQWLSHGKAVQRVLDQFEPLLAALEAIYERKKEPMVRGIQDSLVDPEMIAVMYFLVDVLNATNSLQMFLQAERLNFLNLPT